MAKRLFYMFHLYCNLNYQRQLTNCKWIEWQFLNLSRIVKYFFLTKPFKCRLNCCIFSSFILVDLKSRRQKPIKLLSAYPTLGIGKKYWVFFVKWFFFQQSNDFTILGILLTTFIYQLCAVAPLFCFVRNYEYIQFNTERILFLFITPHYFLYMNCTSSLSYQPINIFQGVQYFEC